MATLLFTVLHFMGHTDAPNEWITFCTVFAIDTVSASILAMGLLRIRMHRQEMTQRTS
jgi:hypothetical protein